MFVVNFRLTLGGPKAWGHGVGFRSHRARPWVSVFGYQASFLLHIICRQLPCYERHQWYSIKFGRSQHCVVENSGIEPGDVGAKHISALD